MKALLAPLYFGSGMDAGFTTQLKTISELLGDVADFASPVKIGDTLPDCDAVVFPQLIGEAFKQMDSLLALGKPMLEIGRAHV